MCVVYRIAWVSRDTATTHTHTHTHTHICTYHRHQSKKCYSLTNLGLYHLTNSMQQNPSWKARNPSASQEIPRILLNPKVHYPVQKNSRRVSWVRSIQSTLSKPSFLRFTLILSSHLRLGLIVSFLHSVLPRTCHMPRPSFFWLDHSR